MQVDIQTKTFVGGAGGHLVITGGVHGDEFEPMAAMRRLMRILQDAHVRGWVTLAPIVNRSSFERCHRFGEDELDLARTCPGREDGSITERTAHALSRLIRSADYYIDLHSGGTTLSVYPLTGYMLHPRPEVLDVQRRMAKAFNLPIVWGTTANLEGRSLSVARDAGIPAIYAEYHGSAVCDPTGVDAYVEGCLNVMAELGILEGRKPQVSRIEHVVEDARENSGHMQIQNPAPCDGYFEPVVRLGERVAAGQLLGTVMDSLGDKVEPIHSSQDGIVIVLRTFPSVRAGNSVAVVLEVDSRGDDAR